MKLWWLSFCDSTRPEGQHFIGACIAEGDDEAEVIERTWEHGCNPGGEVAMVQFPEHAPHFAMPRWTLWRTRDEVESALALVDDHGITTGEMDDLSIIAPVCSGCNHAPEQSP